MRVVRDLATPSAAQGGAPLVMSLGLATGEVVAGYTGLPRRAAYACVGAAVDPGAAAGAARRQRAYRSRSTARTRRALAGRIATEPLAALPAASGTGAKKAPASKRMPSRAT
ncbi:MAG: hypothetical protein U1F67_22290 [Rubrivivax sp.]